MDGADERAGEDQAHRRPVRGAGRPDIHNRLRCRPLYPAVERLRKNGGNDMKIGFIGLGMMGAGMASNLQKAGHELVVNDLTRQAASRHLNAGATWAESPKALAEA